MRQFRHPGPWVAAGLSVCLFTAPVLGQGSGSAGGGAAGAAGASTGTGGSTGTGPGAAGSTSGATSGTTGGGVPPGQGSFNPTGPNPTQTGPAGNRQGRINPTPGMNTQGSATSGLSTGTAGSGGSSRTDIDANYDACVASWDRDTHMSRAEYINVCKRLRRSDEEYRRTNRGAAAR